MGSHAKGAPVAQWVKRWPTDLAVRVQSSLEANSFQLLTVFQCKQSFIINLLSPDMTETLLKRT